MAHYTIELRTLINEGVDIFDIDYQLYNNELKGNFEKKFLDYFYFREIGFETVARFKHELKSKLDEIYPYYEHLYRTTIYDYNAIENYNVVENIERKVDEVGKSSAKDNSNSSSTGSGTGSQYDTPITPRSNYSKTPSFIDESSTNASVSSTGNHESSKNNNMTETNQRVMKGNIGVMTTQDLIMKERQVIINIDKMIFDECENLFMMVF